MRPRRRCSCDRLHLPRRRARVGDLCGFPDTAERVPAGSHKTERRADVRGVLRKQQTQKKQACRQLPAENRAASGEAGRKQSRKRRSSRLWICQGIKMQKK